jgi:hypothetical protein
MPPTGSKAPPRGKEWLHEIKHDGFPGTLSNARPVAYILEDAEQ